MLVVRTRRRFFESLPSTPLWVASLSIVIATIALCGTPMAAYFGFRPLSMVSLAAMSGVVMLYVGTAELTKGLFFRSRLAQSQNGIHEKPTQAGG